MIENLTNKTFSKKNQNDLCIDEQTLNNCLLSKNQFDEKNLKSIILINSLQDFFKRCEISYGKLFYQKNYLISLNEIFTLIENSITAQQQLDKYIYDNNKDSDDFGFTKIKSLNQKFINDLNYNIFSIEKINNNNYFSFNKIKKKTYNKKKSSNSKFLATPHNAKSRINSIFNNIYKDIFINESDIYKKINNTSKEISSYNEISKSDKERDNNKTNNNSYSLNNKQKKNQTKNSYKKIKKNIISQATYHFQDKKTFKNLDEKTVANNNLNNSNMSNKIKKSSTLRSREMIKSKQNRNNSLKLNNTSKTVKSNKNVKCLDIFQVCQNLKKNKNNKNNDTNQIARANSSYYLIDINDFNDSFLKNSLKCLGFSQNSDKKKEIVGIKKVIVSNACKPTNFASHLLDKGKKYISDFKKMDEESKKWK